MRRISRSEMIKQELELKMVERFGDNAGSQHTLSDLIQLMVEKDCRGKSQRETERGAGT